MKKTAKILSLTVALALIVGCIFAFAFTSNAECTEHVDASGNGLCDTAGCSVKLDGLSALSGHSIDLTENITVNLCFDLAETVIISNTAYFDIAINGRTFAVTVADADIVNGYCVIPVPVTAKEIGSTITARLVYGDAVTTVYTYSAKQYCDAILAKPTNITYAPYVELVKALLNYGGYAQKYFDFNTGALVNSGLYSAENDPVKTKVLPSKDIVKEGTLPTGLSHKMASLVLESDITIRHYFELTGGKNISDFTFTANGKTVTPVASGSLYYVDIDGITPRQIDREFAVNVSDGVSTYTAKYSALTYASRKSGSADTSLVELLRAMALYNDAADALPTVFYYEVSGNTVTRVTGLTDIKPEGVSLTLPMMAEKANYEFDGWYTDATFTERVTEIGADDDGSYALYGRYRILFFNYDAEEGTPSPNFNSKSTTANSTGGVSGALTMATDDSGNKYYRWQTAYIPDVGDQKGDDSTILSAKKTTTGSLPISDITSADLSLTFSVDLALDQEYQIISSGLRLLDEDNNGKQTRASFYIIQIDKYGNVSFSNTGEVLFVLTKEFQTVRITIDFKKGMMYAFDKDAKIITSKALQLPANSSATTTEEWVRLFTNYYINWNCAGSDRFTEGTVENPHYGFAFANLKLIEGKDDDLRAAEEYYDHYYLRDRLDFVKSENDKFTLSDFDNTDPFFHYSWAKNSSKYSWVGEPSDITTTAYPDPKPIAEEHPRVMLNADMIPKIKAALEDPRYKAVSDNFWEYANAKGVDGLFPLTPKSGSDEDGDGQADDWSYRYNGQELSYIEAKALAYLLTGEEIYGYEAIYAIKNVIRTVKFTKAIHMDPYHGYGHVILVASFVYDWCYDLLDADDKQQLINGVHNYLFCNLEFHYPPSNMNCVSGHGTGPQLFRHYMTAAVAFADERPDWWDYVAGRFYEEYVPVCNELFKGGWVSQGTSTYGPGKLFSYLWSGWLVQQATGVMPYDADGLQACTYDLLGQVMPNDRYFQSGDGNRNRVGTAVASHWMFITAAMFNDLTALSNAEHYSAGYTRYNNSDFQTTTPSLIMIYLSNIVGNADENYEENLDLIYYTPYPGNQMTAKNSFDDDAAAVFMKIGGLTTTNHDNKDAGTFQIYYKGLLACTSGAYDKYGAPQHKYYLQSTISHNGLLIYNPSLKDTKDGWYSGSQETVKDASSHAAWTDGSCLVGEIIGYDYKVDNGEAKYAYIAGDITKAYNPATVDYVGRRMLTIYTGDESFPMLFIVFDTIESDEANYKKTFLLHTLNEPNVNASDLSAVITATEGGKLVLKNISGADKIQKIGGEGFAYWIGNENDFDGTSASGKNCVDEETPKDDSDIIWGRVELTANGEKRTDMLNLMYVTDIENTETLSSSKIETEDVSGVCVGGYAAVFAKSTSRNYKELSFTTTGEGNVKYFISGLFDGKWTYTVNGGEAKEITVSEESGLAIFEAPAGNVVLTPDKEIAPTQGGRIIYQVNGGNMPAGAPETYVTGQALNLPVPTHATDIFEGWYFDSDFTQKATSTITPTGSDDLKLYAKYSMVFLNEDYSNSAVNVDGSDKTVNTIKYRPNGTGSTFMSVKEGNKSYLKWTLGTDAEGSNANIITSTVTGRTIADMDASKAILSIELKVAREVGKDFLGFAFRLNTPGGTLGKLYLFHIDSDGNVYFGQKTTGQLIGKIAEDGSMTSIRMTVDFINGKIYVYDAENKRITNTNGTANTSDDTDYFAFSVPSAYVSTVPTTLDWYKCYNGYYFYLDENYKPEDGNRVVNIGLIKMAQGNIFE